MRASFALGPSICLHRRILIQDAPVDNNGRGEAFSPTDLVATALGICMATVMGIAAQNKNVELRGMRVALEKHMSEDLPRRVSRLNIEILIPIAEDYPDRRVLQGAVLSYPVQHSIHSDIQVDISWYWQAATPVGPSPVQRVVASANKTESSKDGNTGWMSRFGS